MPAVEIAGSPPKTSKSRMQIAVAVLIVIIPIIRLAFGGSQFQFRDRLDIYSYATSEVVPISLPVLVALMGPHALNERMRARFSTYARVREPAALLLGKQVGRSATFAFLVFLASFLSVGIFCFYGDVATYLNIDSSSTMFKSAYWSERLAGGDAFSILLTHGAMSYIFVYATIVATYAALWSVLTSLCVIHVPNGYFALSIPFLLYQVGNFVAGILGVPGLSPISSIFPSNIGHHTLLDATTTPLLLAIACLLGGWLTWKSASFLPKLS